MCTSQSPLVPSEGFDRFAIGRAEHGEHKEWARAAAARRRVSSDFAARALFVDGIRLVAAVVQRDSVATSVSSFRVGHLQVHTGTGTGTGTGTRIACANGMASLSVVVQPREHHEQHGAVVVSQRVRASPEAIPHVRCLLYTSPSPRDKRKSRMPSSA